MVSDDVVVPGLGVGIVAAVERMPVSGDPVNLYRIHFGEDTRMWIPVDRMRAEGVREPMSPERAEETLSLIADQAAPKERTNWNQRQRRYAATLLSNEPEALAAMLGELAAVLRARRAARKSQLSVTEMALLRRVWRLLRDEMCLVLGASDAEIDARIRDQTQLPELQLDL